MARAIVTQALVNDAAEALVAVGEEPSIIAVQERIGGGSYTTVKRHLEIWKAQQQQPPAVELPGEIAARGSAFIRELWATAAALAEQRSAQVREEAQRQVAASQAALVNAEAVIARMESEAEQQAQRLAELEAANAQMREELAQARSVAQVAEARSTELAKQVEALQRQAQQRDAELTEARTAALEQARLAGELTALQRQLAEQSALVERLAKR